MDFPSAITTAGDYRVQIMLQDGGSIDADADTPVAQGEIHWDGTAEVTLVTIETSLTAEIDENEVKLDQLIVDANKVLNVYGPGE